MSTTAATGRRGSGFLGAGFLVLDITLRVSTHGGVVAAGMYF